MGETTEIGWCDSTFNPWWGCTRVSPACDFCYAEATAKRYGHDVWGKHADRRTLSDHYWNEPLRWERKAAAGEPGANTGRPSPLVFCASMADVFEDHPDLSVPRLRLWELIEATPHLTWLLLSKRPENMRRMTPLSWSDGWPPNVWAGTTMEDDHWAKVRARRIAPVPAVVRFVSYEPALGAVDWPARLAEGRISWLICGGESGGHARPMDPAWAQDARDAATLAGAAFFMKQLGSGWARSIGVAGKGGHWDDLPEPVRARGFPL